MRRQPDKACDQRPDSAIAALAKGSYGVVTRAELLAAGLTPDQIRRRVEREALLPVHRGVYRAGHQAENREATYLAAVRACGQGALLCGFASAHLWRVIRGAPPAPAVVAPGRRAVPGISVSRAKPGSRKPVVRLGIPCVSLPDTIVDLAASMSASQLARACHEAGVLHELTPRQVDEALARRPNAKGAAALRRILHGEEPVTLSALEARFLKLIAEAGLPRPETNVRASGRRVDCRWPGHRLTVELDSYRFHNSRQAWETDRAREREARARGDDLRRFTHHDVFESSETMLAELRPLLLAEVEVRSDRAA